MKVWFYALDDAQHGPVEADEIRAMLTSGMIRRETLVWREGMEEWQPLDAAPEWRDGLVPGHPGGVSIPAQSGLAVASLACGIGSLTLLFTCFVGILAAIPAVICGHLALSRIRDAYPPLAGRGMAIAGLITGYLTIAITLAVALFFVSAFSWLA